MQVRSSPNAYFHSNKWYYKFELLIGYFISLIGFRIFPFLPILL